MMRVKTDRKHQAAVADVLLRMPGVTAEKSFGYDTYKIENKSFAFHRGSDLVIKLTEARVNELVGTCPEFSPYHWKAWLVISNATPDHYDQYEPLFFEALNRVASSGL